MSEETKALKNVEKDPTRDGDIIEGFYAKHQLDCFFKERKKL